MLTNASPYARRRPGPRSKPKRDARGEGSAARSEAHASDRPIYEVEMGAGGEADSDAPDAEGEAIVETPGTAGGPSSPRSSGAPSRGIGL